MNTPPLLFSTNQYLKVAQNSDASMKANTWFFTCASWLRLTRSSSYMATNSRTCRWNTVRDTDTLCGEHLWREINTEMKSCTCFFLKSWMRWKPKRNDCGDHTALQQKENRHCCFVSDSWVFAKFHPCPSVSVKKLKVTDRSIKIRFSMIEK